MRGLEESKHNRLDEHSRAHALAMEFADRATADGRPKEESFADLMVGAIIKAVVTDGWRPLADRARDQHAAGFHPGMQDSIHSAIDAQPPFLAFWQKLNDHRVEQGLDEAMYKEAREAFGGGPTPVGAMTFVGKDWDGIRAVPYPAVHHGGTRPSYHGELRRVTDQGTFWDKVYNKHRLPIAVGQA